MCVRNATYVCLYRADVYMYVMLRMCVYTELMYVCVYTELMHVCT